MPNDNDLREYLLRTPAAELLHEAKRKRDAAHGRVVSYSRKVFIPLTRLCRNICHYCTFAAAPRDVADLYLSPDQVLQIARDGQRAGCREALFTLGDKPELRYAAARDALKHLGHASTIDYLASMCELVLRETTLLPHTNPGVVTRAQITRLRSVSVSQGTMLETLADRLCERGQVHFGSPDKCPAVRLQTIRDAGELRVAFTSGVLIGIGETREERLDSLLALRDLDAEYGHLQEIIVQNFRSKPRTKMAQAQEPDLEDLQWTIAAARLLFKPEMNIQAPPNLMPCDYPLLLDAGINDWGGISPVTPDHVNPEAAWPKIGELERHTAAFGKVLLERLAVYPRYALDGPRWIDEKLVPRVLRAIDASGHARAEEWSPGLMLPCPAVKTGSRNSSEKPAKALTDAIARARDGAELGPTDIVTLFNARGHDFDVVCEAANEVRRETAGDVVRYVVNRNINYTNVCSYRCSFCAFSKASKSSDLRGPAYDLALDEVARRAHEAWTRGATEVCMQGGIHPDYTGETYLNLVHAVKGAVPEMHVHAFSPLEICQGASTLGLSLETYLSKLRDAGLGSLPGTAAEILDDEVRKTLCPDKLKTAKWLEVVESAHRVGLPTTSTIMFGHVDAPEHWARHLLAIRRLQARTKGFTELVPLPFVAMEAPLYAKGRARKGPTFREAVLMHAVSRLALHPLISNIQVSWVKMGCEGARLCLDAGCNDLGGTLMNESISRAAGTAHGQELPPAQMDELIRAAGRIPEQRTTLYRPVAETRRSASYCAPALEPMVFTKVPAKAKACAVP